MIPAKQTQTPMSVADADPPCFLVSYNKMGLNRNFCERNLALVTILKDNALLTLSGGEAHSK